MFPMGFFDVPAPWRPHVVCTWRKPATGRQSGGRVKHRRFGAALGQGGRTGRLKQPNVDRAYVSGGAWQQQPGDLASTRTHRLN